MLQSKCEARKGDTAQLLGWDLKMSPAAWLDPWDYLNLAQESLENTFVRKFDTTQCWKGLGRSNAHAAEEEFATWFCQSTVVMVSCGPIWTQ